jgi:hypothetical protein
MRIKCYDYEINHTKLGLLGLRDWFEKDCNWFEKDYFLISLGRKPNFLRKALEKELKLSYPTNHAAS